MRKGLIPKEDRATAEDGPDDFELPELDLELSDDMEEGGEGSNTESWVPTPAPTMPQPLRSRSTDDVPPPPAASQEQQVSHAMIAAHMPLHVSSQQPMDRTFSL